MKKLLLLIVFVLISIVSNAQNPVGKWKIISDIVEFEGKKFDAYSALLSTRPCVAKIVYEINADKTYRLKASASGCDEKYIKTQEKLHSEEVWKVTGKIIKISNAKYDIGQSYEISFFGNKMIWIGTEGQGKTTFQKL